MCLWLYHLDNHATVKVGFTDSITPLSEGILGQVDGQVSSSDVNKPSLSPELDKMILLMRSLAFTNVSDLTLLNNCMLVYF